jgi:hypothetical protein
MPKMITEDEITVENGRIKVWNASLSAFNVLSSSDRSAKSCVELGWSTAGSDSTMCGSTVYIDGSGVGCSQGAYTWYQARDACRAIGGRLPTLQEMSENVVSGTGCSHDSRGVWTSTPGTTGGHYWIVEGNPDATGETAQGVIDAGEAQSRDASDVDFAGNPLPFGQINEVGIRCVADY